MSLFHLKQKFVSFVFQPACCVCDREIQSPDEFPLAVPSVSSLICSGCFDEIAGRLTERCYHCGTILKTVENRFGNRCRACRGWKSKLERVLAIGNYHGDLQTTIVEVKSDCNDLKACQLGMILGVLFDKSDLPHNIDCVVPVPTHWRRKLGRRGFHVADVIADGFCRVTGLPKSNRMLKSTRYTEKQSKLRPAQRMRNVRGAFAVNRKYPVQNLRVLLIDDVMTSGATMVECARLLRLAGAAQVFGAVTARATGIR